MRHWQTLLHTCKNPSVCTGTIDAAAAERSVSGGGSGGAAAAESSAPGLLWEAERRHRGLRTEPCKALTPEAIGSRWRVKLGGLEANKLHKQIWQHVQLEHVPRVVQ